MYRSTVHEYEKCSLHISVHSVIAAMGCYAKISLRKWSSFVIGSPARQLHFRRPRDNPLSHSLFPTYHPGMTKASVNETLFLFLFRCEKCHKPITAWSHTPKPGTLEEAEKHVLHLHCLKECGWSSAKMGTEALASWAVPWHYETEL
jgi:hypothetical protein